MLAGERSEIFSQKIPFLYGKITRSQFSGDARFRSWSDTVERGRRLTKRSLVVRRTSVLFVIRNNGKNIFGAPRRNVLWAGRSSNLVLVN